MNGQLLTLLPIGLAAALAPCPLATNIAALSYIVRQVGSPRRALAASLLYTLGRASAYMTLGGLLTWGITSAPGLSYWLQEELPLYLGALMMLAGLVILDTIPFPTLGAKPGSSTARSLLHSGGTWGALLLGFLFALALCPPTAALFFGSVLPLSLQAGGAGIWWGITLFGVGTALPVIAIALLLILSTEKAAAVLKHLPRIQQTINTITGWGFLLLGGYWLCSRILLA